MVRAGFVLAEGEGQVSTHPYIPLYVDDYDAHTSHLTPAEDGVYMRLLRLCWRTPGCSLPNDHAWIARKIRLSAADFEAIAKPVIDEYFQVSRGRLVQRRLKAEYDDISRKKSARVKAGKAGGSAKALKSKENAPSNASDLPAHTRAFPEPEPYPDRTSSEDKSSGAEAPRSDLFADDPNALAWTLAKDVLTKHGGLTEPAARQFFGRLLSANKLEARELLTAVSGAVANQTQDPKGYLTRAAQGVAKRKAEPAAAPKRVSFV